jgi:hypothetical protein
LPQGQGSLYNRPMSEKTEKIRELRMRIKELKKQRDNIILERGLLAQDNNDLRENTSFERYTEKEWFLTVRINNLMEEIYKISKST